MATTQNGFLFAWGLNLCGQLGLGDFIDRAYPEHVKTIQSVTQISAGYLHSGAITNTGDLYLWGANPDCRLFKPIVYYSRSGRPRNYCKPQLVSTLSQMTMVSCGTYHTLAYSLVQNQVYASGNPEYGQLGVIHYQFTPKLIQKANEAYIRVPVPTSNPIRQICASDGFSVVLDDQGNVYTFGKGTFGRLGLGHTVDVNNPTRITWFSKRNIRVTAIQAGGRHCLAIGIDET